MDSLPHLRFITCGSVDDGKSTLIGHLLYLTGNLFEDQIQILEAESQQFGNAGNRLDFSLLTDGLLAEREQGITIDVAYRYFRSSMRSFIVADTPGHEQYTRNMITAASSADAALILIDARLGVLPQTRRHFLICAIMQVPNVAFVVNKMDLVAYSEEVFRKISEDCATMVESLIPLGHGPKTEVLPVSAVFGENLVHESADLSWFRGPTVLDWLETQPRYHSSTSGLRLPIQYVVKPGLDPSRWQQEALDQGADPTAEGNLRLYCGRINSGDLEVGNEIVLLPSGLKATIAETVRYGTSSIGVRLHEAVDVPKGEGIFQRDDPPAVSDQFKVRIAWMQDEPLHAGRSYLFQSAYGTALAQVSKVLNRYDLGTYMPLSSETLHKNDLGDLEILLSRPVPFDPYSENRATGGFLLVDRVKNSTAGAGTILHGLRRATNVHWHLSAITREVRSGLLGQRARVLWFTGLSGSGKSTIANLVEQRLSQAGRHTFLLDGDNLRHGLNHDLGFTEADRIENIRRAGEVAKLMVEAGLIVLASFISPYREDRRMVRALLGQDDFIEVFVDTPLHVCETRDPKGLYKKARAGAIPNFTGVSAPYEAPLLAEITLNTDQKPAAECADEVLAWLNKHS